MIPNLPLYISFSFVLLAMYSVFAFSKSNNLKPSTLPIVLGWSLLICVLSYLGVYHYQEGDSISRFGLVLIPIIIFIIYLLRNKSFREKKDFKWSTAVHIVRFPVELLLFQLAIREWLPMEMTYKGWNFDIIPGLIAVILVLWMNYKEVNRKLLLAWNIIGLFLILFILTNGILSQELLYQKFGYSLPNKGIAYSPIILLAGVIVPIVIYTHISDIIKLLKLIRISLDD